MLVDDAVVVRGLFARWVEAESDLEVVATLRTGREAVDQLERVDPDVVVLDVDMPELDGIAALPLLLEKKRDLVVIMASTLTRRNAEISLRALSLGAADYIPKPASNRVHRLPPRSDRKNSWTACCANAASLMSSRSMMGRPRSKSCGKSPSCS
jgi:chemotaxis response regulator CheB